MTIHLTVTLLSALLAADPTVASDVPLDYFEVLSVKPSSQIDHDVELKGPFDQALLETTLTGPQYFAISVGVNGRKVGGPEAYFTWYEIVRPKSEALRTLRLRDPLRAGAVRQISVCDVEFLLSPAQRIVSGPPAPLSDRLSHFKAYRIVDDPPKLATLKLKGAMGSGQRTTSKAILLCVPAEERHHEEQYAVKNAEDCFVVYELAAVQLDGAVTSLDQFGLNRLNLQTSSWICVPAEIVSANAK
jgi:hypothetical protein